MQNLIFITAGDAVEPNEDLVKELLEALGLRSSDNECTCPFCQGRRDGKLGTNPSKLPATGRVPDTSAADPTDEPQMEFERKAGIGEQMKKLEDDLDKAWGKFVGDLVDSVMARGREGRVYKELTKRGWTPPDGIEYPPVKRNDGGYTTEGVAYISGWNECRIATMHLNRKS